MKIISIQNPRAISLASQNLRQGNVIIYPTETCYGLGADATNPQAVTKIFLFKGSRRKKPISIAVANTKMAKDYVYLNSTAKNLYRHFLPGPITVISRSKGKVDKRLEGPNHSLGIRLPDYPFTLKLIKTFARPITSTSANISRGKTPYSRMDILKQLSARKEQLVSLFLDAGTLPRRPPSAVVDTTLNEPTLLRQGAINFDKLRTTTIISHSEAETQQLGEKLVEKFFPFLKNKTIVFALQGELGAGKTQLAKGVGKFLGVKEKITSPTYVLLREYPFEKRGIRGTFYHLDAWRAAPETFTFLKNYLHPGNVIFIEWVEKNSQFLRVLKTRPGVKIILLQLQHQSPSQRIIRFLEN